MAKRSREQIIPSSGNVFADMGLPDADELDTKVRLGAAICRIVERRKLAQIEVAAALGINQPKVSALLHYKLEGFSVERLMRFLTALGHDVEIVIRPRPKAHTARIAVRAA
ncbi:MAG: helix-turn-helix transcriptional regulator [Terracidiphilus sp.]|jgi:predicted XRE-type DNA-binding protein